MTINLTQLGELLKEDKLENIRGFQQETKTQKYQVWHAKKMFPFEDMDTNKFPEDFELAAEVTTTDLDSAYMLTNHIHCAWYENKGVQILKDKKRARSTSVGDIIVEQDGAKHKVANFGFKKI